MLSIQGLICKDLKRQDKLPEKFNSMACEPSVEWKLENYRTGKEIKSGYVGLDTTYHLVKYVGGEKSSIDFKNNSWSITANIYCNGKTNVFGTYTAANHPKFFRNKVGANTRVLFDGCGIGLGNLDAVEQKNFVTGIETNAKADVITTQNSVIADVGTGPIFKVAYNAKTKTYSYHMGSKTLKSLVDSTFILSKPVMFVTNLTGVKDKMNVDNLKIEFNGEVVWKGKNI